MNKLLMFIAIMFLWCFRCNAQTQQQDIQLAHDIIFQCRMDEWDHALSLLLPYAQKGDAEAQALVGEYFSYDKNPRHDYKQAFEWFTKADKKGNGEAAWGIAQMYITGNFVSKDLNAAKKYIMKSIDARYWEACNFYAEMFKDGNSYLGCEKSLEKAAQWYEYAGDAGNEESYYDAALINYNEIQNFKEAKRILLKAFKTNKEFAPGMLASWFYYNDNLFYKKDDSLIEPYKITEGEAFRYNRIAAEHGDHDAQKRLGDYFMEGKFVVQSFEEAIKWYKKATEQGEPNATAKLADCYESLFNSTLNEKYLRLYIRWKYIAEKKGVYQVTLSNLDDWLAIYDKDVKQEDEFKKYYDAGYLNANNYPTYKEWEKNVVMRLSEGSDVDVNIPSGNKMNPHLFALVIANDEYKYEEDVPYVDNDGEVFASYCSKVFGVKEDNLHFVSNATLNTMKHEVNWLCEQTKGDEQASIILYYAGHGIPSEDQVNSYLLPVDGYAKDNSTGYSINQIVDELGKTNVPSFVFLDACFSGAKRTDGMLLKSRSVAVKAKDVMPKGKTVILSACSGMETALPYEEQQHGLFTYFLLRKIKETSGNVTIQDLYNDVKNNVYKTSKSENKKVQTPTLNTPVENQSVLSMKLVK